MRPAASAIGMPAAAPITVNTKPSRMILSFLRRASAFWSGTANFALPASAKFKRPVFPALSIK
jgi:hypothetical protein